MLVAVGFGVYGLVNGAVETLQQVLVGETTPEGQRIEAFAWVFSVMWAGFGIGRMEFPMVAQAVLLESALSFSNGTRGTSTNKSIRSINGPESRRW